MAGTAVVKALVASLLLFSSASASPFAKRQTTLTLESVQKQALANAYKVLDGTLSDGLNRSSSCKKDIVAVRKEYGDLTKEERKAYTTAVNFVHMNMTPTVHATANFMHWHRYYIWAYETALRTECGYKGYQPYWNWAKYKDLVNSPIFNSDEWSMGGNGDPIGPHAGLSLGPGATLPGGPGGGCISIGPFTNLTIHLGPLSPTMDPKLNIKPNPRADGYGDNPRCHRRDVSNFFTENYLRPQDLLSHIISNKAIGTFQDSLQASGTNSLAALHIAGHFSIWGDPGGDVFVSPAEPAFWLHHSQLNRHWWVWAMFQEKEVGPRTSMYEGGTHWQIPKSPRGKPTDEQELDVAAPPGKNHIASNQFFSPTAGPLCYVYA